MLNFLAIYSWDHPLPSIWTENLLRKVDEESCTIQLTRRVVDQHGNIQDVMVSVIGLSGIVCGVFSMVITETNHIRISPCMWHFPSEIIKWMKTNRSFDAWGGVIDTSLYFYARGGRLGLLAVESKKNTTEEDAEVVTAAHYFVKSSGTCFYGSTGANIGLSVVAKFRASNGKFQTTVEGLEQHPVSSLHCMIDEVNTTGIWKPTMCPHCYQKRRGKLLWQSDSEDSDSVSIPVPRANPRNARGVSNGGRLQGNGNGNFIENNVMVFKRRC